MCSMLPMFHIFQLLFIMLWENTKYSYKDSGSEFSFSKDNRQADPLHVVSVQFAVVQFTCCSGCGTLLITLYQDAGTSVF